MPESYMEYLKFAADSLYILSSLTAKSAGVMAWISLPLGCAISYGFGREHEFGFKDGKSAVKFFFKTAAYVDLRDILRTNKGRMSEDAFEDKYKHLGLENYFTCEDSDLSCEIEN